MSRCTCRPEPNGMCESCFVVQIMGLAKLHGWLVVHFRPALTERGWRTPLQGDAGFVDLVMTRLSRVIFAECKSKRGKVSPLQRRWLDMLESTGKVEVYVWGPSDWPAIEAVLL